MPFPSSIPSYTGFTSNETLQAAGHAAQHNQEQGDIVGLATKLGTGVSIPTSTSALVGNGNGTSTWGQIALNSMVTGVLPTTNGGTGTTSTTGTGSLVYATAPTIATPVLTQPTITDFSNAQHNHQNTTGGGTLSSLAMPALSLGNQTLSNPYKFSAYAGTTTTLGAGTFTKIAFNSEEYDTSSSFDSVTNYRFTAPIAGFYKFDASIDITGTATGDTFIINLYKNGSLYKASNRTLTYTGMVVELLLSPPPIQLAVNDYLEIYGYNGAGGTRVVNSGQAITYFGGYLVSTT